MIIVKLNGGLGNQLFQYAFGKYLALKNNTNLKLDVTEYQGVNPYRLYGLKDFNINENFASQEEIIKLKFNEPNFIIRLRYWLRRKPVNLKHYKTISSNYYAQKKSIFLSEMMDIPDNSYVEGFWQSEKYFKEIKDIVRKEFFIKTPPSKDNQEMIKKINSTNSVSLHVRRTDYINSLHFSKFGSICTLDYYKNAIEYMNNVVKAPVYYIFSDDIEWAKSNIYTGCESIYVDLNNEKTCYEDLRLMSSCKHNIIANSTFSWWGAWLNSNHDKIIITSDKWTNDNSIPILDIVPQEWIKISNKG